MKDFLNKSSVVTQEMFFISANVFSSEQALEIAEAPENGPDTKPGINFASP